MKIKMKHLPATRNKLKFLLLCGGLLMLLSLSTNKLLAQTAVAIEEIHLDPLGVNEGLSVGYATDILQDTTGYIWISTFRGLNRYDGIKIKKYFHDPNDPRSIKNDKIKNIFLDSRGWLWGTTPTGIFLMDYEKDAFVNFDNNHSFWMHEDANGILWTIPQNQDSTKLVQIPPTIKTPSDLFNFPKDFIFSKPQDVYAGLPKIPVLKHAIFNQYGIWFKKQDTLFNYTLDAVNKIAKLRLKVDLSLPNKNQGTYEILEDPDRNRFLYVVQNQILDINLENGQLTPLFSSTDQQPSNEYLTEPPLFIHKNHLWYRNHILNLHTGIWKKLIGIPNRSDFELTRYFIDKFDNIWFSTTGYGTFKSNHYRSIFHYHGDGHMGPTIGPIRDLGEKRISLQLSLNKFETLHYITGEHHSVFDEQVIKGMAQLNTDSSYNIWVSTYIKPNKRQLLQFESNGVLKKEFGTHLTLKNLHYSGQLLWERDSTLIFTYANHNDTTWHISLQFIQPYTSNSSKTFRYKMNPNHYYDNIECETVYKTEDGKFWIGLNTAGMLIFDPEKESWEHFIHEKEGAHRFPGIHVISFLADPLTPQKTMWIGTSKGLIKMDIPSKTFSTYTTKDGLPDDFINGLLSDHYNNLWLSTNYGLCNFNPTTKVVRNFTVEDGLQHNEFNRNSYLKKEDGHLFFGGVGGLTWFDPKDLYDEAPSATVVINGIRLNNQPLVFTRQQSSEKDKVIIDKPMDYMSEIVIDYDQRYISFELASLDPTSPKKNKYRYILEGLDDEWINLGNVPEVTLTNLNAGEYTLRVQATNHLGNWSPHEASIQLVVLPPWWATWWFRGLIFSLIGFSIYSYTQGKTLAKQRLQSLRDQISQDLHDEIGSNLSSISLYGLVANKSVTKDPEKAKRLLTQINNKSLQIIESMNDIVWAIKSEYDSLPNVISRMRSYASEIENTGEWTFDIQEEPSLNKVRLNMIQRRNIYLIFKEAVNNAIKYSGGDHIVVQFKESNQIIELVIQDNGFGFDQKKDDEPELSLGGNGLPNMEKRASDIGGQFQIDSSYNKGTKVTLSFMLE